MIFRITFMDGPIERVEGVTRAEQLDGVLHLFRRHGSDDHIGSYPIANIRKWEKEGADQPST